MRNILLLCFGFGLVALLLPWTTSDGNLIYGFQHSSRIFVFVLLLPQFAALYPSKLLDGLSTLASGVAFITMVWIGRSLDPHIGFYSASITIALATMVVGILFFKQLLPPSEQLEEKSAA